MGGMAGTDGTMTLLTGRVVTPSAVLDDGAVVVQGDRIAWVGRRADLAGAPSPLAEATPPHGWLPGRTLLPGLVDVHCHGGAGASSGPTWAQRGPRPAITSTTARPAWWGPSSRPPPRAWSPA